MGVTASRRNSGSDTGEESVTDVGGDDSRSWSQVYSSSLASWKYSAVLWGFDPRIDYTSNVKARLQPWCTNGRYFSVNHDSPDKSYPDGSLSSISGEPYKFRRGWPCAGYCHYFNDAKEIGHFPNRHCDRIMERPYFLLTIREGCFHQDTHIRLPCAYQQRLHREAEPSGHYLKASQVVGYRGGIAVVQLNCVDQVMEFLVVHMKTSAVLGIFKEETGGRHYLCDVIISPDLTSFILKPNAMYVLNFCRGEYKNVMKVISCKGENCPVLSTMFEGAAVRPFVAFDPRYRSKRVAIANYLKSGRDIVCIYDLEENRVVMESDTSTYQTTHNIVFSPDGIYLASLILGRSVKDGLFNFPRVLIYASNDLSVLHKLRTNYLAEVPTLTPAALFPLFSETGTHLAVAYGEQGTFYQQVAGVYLYKVPLLLDLQSLCRLTIRQYFDGQDVQNLPLPNKLKAYLRFQPSYG